MAIKPDVFEEELQEIMEALREAYDKLWVTSDLTAFDSESGLTFFWPDWSTETYHFKFSDGNKGSISFAEYEKIKKHGMDPCFLCAGTLDLIFDPESKPVLCLGCDRCGATHKVVNGKLCLLAD